ncbi:MAG: asparagine synthase (glutamine-hydrolyzing) [Acidobacteriota bacterium]
MCGIFGAINTQGYFGPGDFTKFVQLTNVVKERGPDSAGYRKLLFKAGKHLDDSRFDVFLGHRRLSIIDLSEEANQPMRGERGTWITFNGEIFNYSELRDELKPYSFRTSGDTEAILATYERHGSRSFTNFNGEWAFCIVDLAKGEAVLSRDRFSIKPLYYTMVHRVFYFSSEIKQLLPLLPNREVNASTLQAYLGQGLVDANDETLFREIHKVPARHNLILSLRDGSIRKEQYWAYKPTNTPSNHDDAVAGFRDLFRDSVRLRLRSDVTVGGLLSGGLDSSSIALTAKALHHENFKTYSVVPFSPENSELRFIHRLVTQCGLSNRKLFVDESNIVTALEDTILRNDEPPGGFSAVAHFRMMQKIKAETGIKVLLSGQGSDEILLGYRKFFFFLLQELSAKRSYFGAGRQVVGSFLRGTTVWQFNVAEARRYLKGNHHHSHSYLKGPVEWIPLGSSGGLRERQMSDIDRYSVPNLTHYEDRNSAGCGLEIRLPFLDYRLVNYCLGLSDDLKIRNGWSKYALRASMHELPRSIRWRRDKQGFILPEKHWLQTELASLIRSTFKGSVLGELGFIDPKQFLNYYEQFQKGSEPIWYTDISRALMAELWARLYLAPHSARAAIATGQVGRAIA